jgi:hypothetical protein
MSEIGEYLLERMVLPNLTRETGLDKEAVDSIVALINKTVNDFNREKNLDGRKIEQLIIDAIKSKAINIE